MAVVKFLYLKKTNKTLFKRIQTLAPAPACSTPAPGKNND